MPISARLSRTFHEVLGEEPSGDLMEWMHHMEQSRSELRDLNELNLARIDSRFAQVDARFEQVDLRFREAEARLDARFAQLDTRIERQYGRLLAWSFGFWATTLLALIALLRTSR